MKWMIIGWTLVVALLLWRAARGKRWQLVARIASVCLVLVAVLTVHPAVGPEQPPTQVVYRFDEHRYLELTGWRCEGGVYYVDAKRNIRGEISSQYTRVFLPPITHADNDGNFIFFPFSDLSGFMISKDYGKTFGPSSWIDSRPGVEEIKKVTVVNQQAFLEGKDGRLFVTSKPIGNRWGQNVVDVVNVLPYVTTRDRPEFQDMPKSVPPVKDYKGWTEMRCDPDKPGHLSERDASLTALHKNALAVLRYTVALPVTFAAWLWTRA